MTKGVRIIMMKREAPRRVTLTNDRTFVARYKRVTRAYLPANIRLRRSYKQSAASGGRRCQQVAVQQGHGFGSDILKFKKRLLKHQLCYNWVGIK